jgi:hypothetical protein
MQHNSQAQRPQVTEHTGQDDEWAPARNGILIPWSSSTQPSHYNMGTAALKDMPMEFHVQFKTPQKPSSILRMFQSITFNCMVYSSLTKNLWSNVKNYTTNTNTLTHIPNIPKKYL